MYKASEKGYKYFIRLLICSTKILNLCPLKINIIIDGNEYRSISTTKLIFCIIFHVTMNIGFVLIHMPISMNLSNTVLKVTTVILIPVNSLCHAVAFTTYMVHCKRIHDLIFNSLKLSEKNNLFSKTNKIYKGTILLITKYIFIIISLINTVMCFGISSSIMLTSCFQSLMYVSIYIVDLYVITSIDIVKSWTQELNTTLFTTEDKLRHTSFKEVYKLNKNKNYCNKSKNESYLSSMVDISEIRSLMNKHNELANLTCELSKMYSPFLLFKTIKLFVTITCCAFSVVLNANS
ncbi:hypothetical protein L9F63_010389, partial [Diploptera punctata]